jgi:hypothetical protein
MVTEEVGQNDDVGSVPAHLQRGKTGVGDTTYNVEPGICSERYCEGIGEELVPSNDQHPDPWTSRPMLTPIRIEPARDHRQSRATRRAARFHLPRTTGMLSPHTP